MNYTIYNSVTGEVLRTVTCSSEMIELQLQQDESFIEGKVNEQTQYFINGSVCNYTETELALKQNIPFGYCWKMPEKIIEQILSDEAIYNYHADLVRQKRDEMLKVVDGMNPMRWETLTAEQQQQWREYRQALLDIPQQEGFPFSVIFPNAPV